MQQHLQCKRRINSSRHSSSSPCSLSQKSLGHKAQEKRETATALLASTAASVSLCSLGKCILRSFSYCSVSNSEHCKSSSGQQHMQPKQAMQSAIVMHAWQRELRVDSLARVPCTYTGCTCCVLVYCTVHRCSCDDHQDYMCTQLSMDLEKKKPFQALHQLVTVETCSKSQVACQAL